jgi:hypothetical protein
MFVSLSRVPQYAVALAGFNSVWLENAVADLNHPQIIFKVAQGALKGVEKLFQIFAASLFTNAALVSLGYLEPASANQRIASVTYLVAAAIPLFIHLSEKFQAESVKSLLKKIDSSISPICATATLIAALIIHGTWGFSHPLALEMTLAIPSSAFYLIYKAIQANKQSDSASQGSTPLQRLENLNKSNAELAGMLKGLH